MPQTINRRDLRNLTTSSAYISAAIDFSLENNMDATAYFSIQGIDKDIFNSASISNVQNATFVSGTNNAAFIIDRNSTGSLTLTPTGTIGASEIGFIAPNPLIFNPQRS